MPNAENVDKTTNPSFKHPPASSVVENEAEFVLVKINMLQYPCVHREFKNMKNFVIEIYKRSRSGKPDMEEDLYIE